MKTIIVNNKTFDVKTTFEDITIPEFNKCMLILQKDKSIPDNEKYEEMITVLSDMTPDEIGDMDFEDFTDLIRAIQVSDFIESDDSFIGKDEVEFNGVKYKANLKEGTYKFNTKETFLIKAKVQSSPANYIDYLAAVVFREVLEDGTVSKDLTPNAIANRKQIFSENLKMNIIAPYLLEFGYLFSKYSNA